MPHIITNVRIIPANLSDFQFQARVMGTVEDEDREIFRYYEDELYFTASEFEGKTIREAHEIKLKKDVAFIQAEEAFESRQSAQIDKQAELEESMTMFEHGLGVC